MLERKTKVNNDFSKEVTKMWDDCDMNGARRNQEVTPNLEAGGTREMKVRLK